ncbi:MAG: DUF1963 domain-containing protein [Saprospiraceae bacterium]
MNWKSLLPESLQPFLPELEATERACVRLQVETTPPSHPWQSMMGATLFWPQGMDWPCSPQGRPLFGLLQLNLAEMPSLPTLPTAGILQFFISDNAFWGADPHAPSEQQHFRVVFHAATAPESVVLINDFSFLPPFEGLPLQATTPLRVTGLADTMPMTPDDYRFYETLGFIFEEMGEDKWAALFAYRKAIGSVGHRLGGYASFAQDDPRTPEDELELLLQLDTDSSSQLHWGDMGVAHWFYSPQPTTRGLEETAPFQHVWYEWQSA